MTDDIFLDYFRQNFLSHLRSAPRRDEEGRREENQVADLVEAAKIQGLGKLSRIFDAMTIPIVDKDTFITNLAKAEGNMEMYMRPIFKEVAIMLLSEDKSRLHDDVIQAIGLVNYAEIVKGQIKEGKVIAREGDESAFKATEAEAARMVLSSIALSYSQSLLAYAHSSEEKECRDKLATLFDKNKTLQNYLDQGVTKYAPAAEESYKHVEDLADLNKKIDKVIKTLAEVNDNEDTAPLVIAQLSSNITALIRTGDDFLGHISQQYMSSVIGPLNTMATQFDIKMLDKSLDKPDLQEMIQKVEIFYRLVEKAEKDYNQFNIEHPDSLSEGNQDNLLKLFTILKDQLQTAREAPELFTDKQAQADSVQKNYNKAITTFAENASAELLNIEPPKPVMHIFLRILRAIFIGSLTSKTEAADQSRFKEENTLKEDLLKLKEQLKGNSTEEVEVENNDIEYRLQTP